MMLHVDINRSYINILDCKGQEYATLKHTKVKKNGDKKHNTYSFWQLGVHHEKMDVLFSTAELEFFWQNSNY